MQRFMLFNSGLGFYLFVLFFFYTVCFYHHHHDYIIIQVLKLLDWSSPSFNLLSHIFYFFSISIYFLEDFFDFIFQNVHTSHDYLVVFWLSLFYRILQFMNALYSLISLQMLLRISFSSEVICSVAFKWECFLKCLVILAWLLHSIMRSSKANGRLGYTAVPNDWQASFALGWFGGATTYVERSLKVCMWISCFLRHSIPFLTIRHFKISSGHLTIIHIVFTQL